ncbi:hypothetical protein H2200_002328 [Cladophialophora chaetospira]|uniref:RRN7-type domain-containing protein n=1 Tax=Cladophialophora chaetospira TaxID=386627 RepID=A0AA38XIP7_9EURO|nr:hypothetical protein H2200_002328 [Cladophialophora chaetospira]
MDDDEECLTCGSTEFHEEDGRIFCHNGHDQGRGLATAADDADFGRQGTVVRKKIDKEKIKISKEHRLQDASSITEEHGDATDQEPTTASSGEESDTDLDVRVKTKAREQSKSSYLYPKLIDTIALAYMGIMMLRRPVGQAILLRWILEEDIPFVRAIRHVPQDMKDRLPGEYHQSLDTTTRLPEADDLQKAVWHRVRWFNASFGMIMPAINHTLLLLKYIRRLAIPLEVYTMARRLNKITNYNFAYPDMTILQEKTRRQPTTYPEAQLMSLVVVATRLLFPFDSEIVKRYPKDPNDPTTLRLNWSSWLDAKTNFDNAADAARDPTILKPGSEIHVTDKDILDMTDEQLDNYMDWYQTTWIKNNTSTQASQEGGGIDKEILDMFPLHDVPERVSTRKDTEHLEAEEDVRVTARIKQVQHSLKSRRAISKEEESERGLAILRPGAHYIRYTRVQDLDRAAATGDNKQNAVKVFHEEAAATACLSFKALLLAVNRTEEKIEKWLIARRREDFFGSDEDPDVSVENFGTRNEDEMEVVPETSPPARLARELGELGLGLSPYVEDDGDVDMEMLTE